VEAYSAWACDSARYISGLARRPVSAAIIEGDSGFFDFWLERVAFG
jgi:hypothetical protein